MRFDNRVGNLTPLYEILFTIMDTRGASVQEEIQPTLSTHIDQDFVRMIDFELKQTEQQKLLELLREFQPIFGPRTTGLGNTALVHGTNTGQTRPITLRF